MGFNYEAHKAAIIAAWREHESVAAVHREVGGAYSTLTRKLAEWGERGDRPKALTETDAAWWHDPELLRAALKEHGSFPAISRACGGSPKGPTLRYWADKHGIGSRRPRAANPVGDQVVSAPTSADRIEQASDDELVRMSEAFGVSRMSVILGVSPAELAAIARRRGLDLSERGARRSPRVMALEREVKDLKAAGAATGELSAAIRDAAEEMGEALISPAPPRVIAAAPPVHESTCDVVLFCSDLHYGMFVDPEEVPGGDYNSAVFQKYLDRWVEAAVSAIQGVALSWRLGSVWIIQGGDFIEGERIYPGQHHHSEFDAGRQVTQLAPLWAAAIAEVSLAAKAIQPDVLVPVTSVTGNHGVHGGRKSGAVPPTLSYDYLTYEMVATILDSIDHAVTFYDRRAHKAVYLRAANHVVLAIHGDQDRGGGLIGVPVVTGMRNDLQGRVQTKIDHHLRIAGHVHKDASLSTGADSRIAWGGAYPGATNLSIGRGGAAGPSQSYFVIHERAGLIQTGTIRLAQPGELTAEHEIIDAA